MCVRRQSPTQPFFKETCRLVPENEGVVLHNDQTPGKILLFSVGPST